MHKMNSKKLINNNESGFVLVSSLFFLIIVTIVMSWLTIEVKNASIDVSGYRNGLIARTGSRSAANRAMSDIRKQRDKGLGFFNIVNSGINKAVCIIEDENSKYPINCIWDKNGYLIENRKQELIKLVNIIGGDESEVNSLINWFKNRKQIEKQLKPHCTFRDLNIIEGWIISEEKSRKIFSDRKNERFNINTVKKEVLMAVLDNKDMVNSFIGIRDINRFDSWSDLDRKIGNQSKVFRESGNRFTFKSDLFTLKAKCSYRNRMSDIFAVVKRSADKISVLIWKEQLS